MQILENIVTEECLTSPSLVIISPYCTYSTLNQSKSMHCVKQAFYSKQRNPSLSQCLTGKNICSIAKPDVKIWEYGSSFITTMKVWTKSLSMFAAFQKQNIIFFILFPKLQIIANIVTGECVPSPRVISHTLHPLL